MGEPEYSTALVTGGSSGIGFAIARWLVVHGSHVIIVARDKKRLAEAAEELVSSGAAGSVTTLSVDVSDRDQVDEAVRGLYAEDSTLPSIDLLVSCAGIAHPDYFEVLDSSIFDMTIDINLRGTWNVLKAFVPKMRTDSRIVLVSSVAGFVGTFGYTPYSASKFGIIGLAEALRNEMAMRGISVQVLCPPDTDTPGLALENRTKPPETLAISGNAGLLKPEKVAESLFKGLRRRRFIIIPGFQGKCIYMVKRLFPHLVFALIDADARKAAAKKDRAAKSRS